MKTAISLSNEVFDAAEKLRERLGMPRSRLYTKAVEAFVKAHRTAGVKEALDAVYAKESAQLDPVLRGMQHRTVGKGRAW